MASDVGQYYTTFTPGTYPYTVSYEWETQFSDGILSLPAFIPQESYNQTVEQADYRLTFSKDCRIAYQVLNINADISRSLCANGDSCYTVSLSRLPPLAALPYSACN